MCGNSWGTIFSKEEKPKKKNQVVTIFVPFLPDVCKLSTAFGVLVGIYNTHI